MGDLSTRAAPQKEARSDPQKEQLPKPSTGPVDSEVPAQQDMLQRCRSIAADNQKLLMALRSSRQSCDRKVQLPLLPLPSGASSTVSGGSGRSTPSDPSPRASECGGPYAFGA